MFERKTIAVKERKQFIDYAKAFGIVLVLLNHLGYDNITSYLLPLLPIFFVSAGYVFKLGGKSFGSYVKQKGRKLLLPFWLAMFVYMVMEILRAEHFGYSTPLSVIRLSLTETIYGSGMVPILGRWGKTLAADTPWQELTTPPVDIILPSNCHLWFLPAMFSACCIYYFFAKYKERINGGVKIALGILLLLIAGIETVPGMSQLPYGFGRGCVGAVFFMFGGWLKENEFFERKNKHIMLRYFIAGLAVSMISLLLGTRAGGMVISNYGPYPFFSVFVFTAGGCGASLTLLILCRYLELSSLNSLKKMLAVIGRNTMSIYLWQFLIINIADVIFLTLTGIEAEPANFYSVVISGRYFWYKLALLCITTASLTYYGLWKEKLQKNRSLA